jgi:hypothetical protein
LVEDGKVSTAAHSHRYQTILFFSVQAVKL